MTVTEPPLVEPDLLREEGRWTHQWKELYTEVITSGLCTGCSACVIACPHDVIGYEHKEGGYRPFHLEDDDLGQSDCIHGQKGCTSCTRACPRFRDWEPTADEHLFGRVREIEEIHGIAEQTILVRASDDHVHELGQDGGLVSAILIWLLDEGYIDGALVSYLEGDGSTWRARPGVATNKQEVLDAAGSRYTYSANWLAYDEAMEKGLENLALVGMGCQTSASPVMWSRKIGKIGKPIRFNIGLLCSKTFDDRIFDELFDAKYGIARASIKKMNIKGVFQIWTNDGEYHEVPLKECHAWTREGCNQCPDFAAEHADISTGGIGKFNDWTLTVVRTELGREVMTRMAKAGVVQVKPAEEDPAAVALMDRLSRVSRNRWPADAVAFPKRMPPPPPKKKKKAAPTDDAAPKSAADAKPETEPTSDAAAKPDAEPTSDDTPEPATS
ncbi:MAG: Coenzyme F420 hydrogenase/dehydrogenase, beta subunit C-terminal domain [Acidimicrobiia bacterium]|nr:Coenzyme F420 hydrogenase/dehydrogenase, beta subunit C-terminal domain [Acidimicrobiia bacterium]